MQQATAALHTRITTCGHDATTPNQARRLLLHKANYLEGYESVVACVIHCFNVHESELVAFSREAIAHGFALGLEIAVVEAGCPRRLDTAKQDVKRSK